MDWKAASQEPGMDDAIVMPEFLMILLMTSRQDLDDGGLNFGTAECASLQVCQFCKLIVFRKSFSCVLISFRVEKRFWRYHDGAQTGLEQVEASQQVGHCDASPHFFSGKLDLYEFLMSVAEWRIKHQQIDRLPPMQGLAGTWMEQVTYGQMPVRPSQP